MDMISDSPHPLHLLVSEGTPLKCAQGLGHLGPVPGAAHADIHRRMGQDKAVAIAA